MQTMFIVAYIFRPRQSFLKNSAEEIDNISLLVYNSFVKGKDAVTASLLFRCSGRALDRSGAIFDEEKVNLS